MQSPSLLTRIGTAFLALSFLSVPALMSTSAYAGDRRSDKEHFERRHDDDWRGNRKSKWRKGDRGNDRSWFGRKFKLRKSRNNSRRHDHPWWERGRDRDHDNDRKKNRRGRRNHDRD